MVDDRLLCEIADLLGRQCLSDLHNLSRNELAYAVGNLMKRNYSAEEWNYTLSYILEEAVEMEEFHGISDLDKLLRR